MIEAIYMISDFFLDIIAVFDAHPLQIGPYQVSWFGLIFAGLIVCMMAAVFWKGAKA